MKKTLILISSLLVVAGVFSAQAFANGAKHGDSNRGHHGKKSHINVWSAKLTPPGATGPTAAVAHYGKHNATPTGPIGRATFAQNKKRYLLAVKVRGLTASTNYSVALYKDEDGKGSLSTANPIQDPPTIKPIVTDANGLGKTWTDGPRSDFSLDKDVKYYVAVKNSAGETVLAGTLKTKWHGRHRGCDGHGLSGSHNHKSHRR